MGVTFLCRAVASLSLTLKQVQEQQQQEDGPGGHLDPPAEEKWEEDHSDDALPSQRGPRAVGLGLGKRGACGARGREGPSRDQYNSLQNA